MTFNHRFVQSTGSGQLPGHLLGVVSVLLLAQLSFGIGLLQFLALGLIVIGLHWTERGSVLGGAVAVTLGIGLQLLILGWVSVTELLALWPLSLIVYGLVVFLIERAELQYNRKRPTTGYAWN